MDQPNLFEDSFLDAIGTAIKAAGGFKVVAAILWPARKIETAYARLKACVDDKQPEELTPDEIKKIAELARKAGDHSIMRYLGMELGYEVKVISPEDQKTALQRAFVDAMKKFEHLAGRMDRLGMGGAQ